MLEQTLPILVPYLRIVFFSGLSSAYRGPKRIEFLFLDLIPQVLNHCGPILSHFRFSIHWNQSVGWNLEGNNLQLKTETPEGSVEAVPPFQT